MVRPLRIRGLSLLETIISLFLMVAATLIVTQLFHTSLRHGNVTERRLLGAFLCDGKIEEIRAWASDPDNYEGTWAPYDNVTTTDPEYTDYQITTTLSNPSRLSPATDLESIHPVGDRKEVNESLRGVTVTCVWGTRPVDRLEVSTLVSAPPREWHATNPLEITQTSSVSPWSRDLTNSFRVRGFDENGREIQDITFHWDVVAMDGNATVASSSRDGREAVIGNWIFGFTGARLYRPGNADVVVTARFGGEIRRASRTVSLDF